MASRMVPAKGQKVKHHTEGTIKHIEAAEAVVKQNRLAPLALRSLYIPTPAEIST